jgi:hypothetical protein
MVTVFSRFFLFEMRICVFVLFISLSFFLCLGMAVEMREEVMEYWHHHRHTSRNEIKQQRQKGA